jgi:single-strand DNA-binding protein
MASFNRVILLGNITREFEIKYLQSGTAVTEIGLAVNDKYKNQNGEWVEEVTFVDVTLWGRTAEVAGEYLSKGSPVLIEGRLKLHSWEKDGQKHSKLRVTCDRMQMVGGKGGGGGRGGSQSYDDSGDYGDAPSGPPQRSSAPQRGDNGGGQRSNQPSAPPPPTEDEIPF